MDSEGEVLVDGFYWITTNGGSRVETAFYETASDVFFLGGKGGESRPRLMIAYMRRIKDAPPMDVLG
jgi:hypothetical protein